MRLRLITWFFLWNSHSVCFTNVKEVVISYQPMRPFNFLHFNNSCINLKRHNEWMRETVYVDALCANEIKRQQFYLSAVNKMGAEWIAHQSQKADVSYFCRQKAEYRISFAEHSNLGFICVSRSFLIRLNIMPRWFGEKIRASRWVCEEKKKHSKTWYECIFNDLFRFKICRALLELPFQFKFAVILNCAEKFSQPHTRFVAHSQSIHWSASPRFNRMPLIPIGSMRI